MMSRWTGDVTMEIRVPVDFVIEEGMDRVWATTFAEEYAYDKAGQDLGRYLMDTYSDIEEIDNQ